MRLRESLKVTGHTTTDAWTLALEKFQPVKAADLESSVVDIPDEPLDLTKSNNAQDTEIIAAQVPVEDEEYINRTAPKMEIIEWVGRNIQSRGVKYIDAPSPDAWALLQWAKRSGANESQFWGKWFGAMTKDRAIEKEEEKQEEVEEVDATKGSEHVLELIGRFKHGAVDQAQGPEDVVEPGEAGDDPGGSGRPVRNPVGRVGRGGADDD